MTRSKLILVLLFVTSFSLAIRLQSFQDHRQSSAPQSGDMLALLLGNTRKMFAQQMFAKADAYFHRGNYPSIFDQVQHHEENHMAEARHEDGHDDHADHDEHEDGPPAAEDWLEEFGRHFYPTTHVHLSEGEEREMLPWLRIAAQLDPQNIETYAVAAYWLREKLHRVDEAERVLRDGLRANPNSPELLYELGRLFFENREDYSKARNVWQFAQRRWQQVEAGKTDPDKILLAKILGGLARTEMHEGRNAAAVGYLKQLQLISPSPEQLQKQIDTLSQNLKPSSP
ncbi:MAG: tetratricopeptide repeat protein [Verrucomicrobiota bacterium]